MGWEFDESEVHTGLVSEGEHLAFLIRAELGRSQRGEEKADLEFQSEAGAFICYDTVMLQGKGLGIGLKKLQQLGVAHKDESTRKWKVVDVEEWAGRAVYLWIVHEQYAGRDRAKVDFSKPDFGYRQAHVEPETSKPQSADDEDIPF